MAASTTWTCGCGAHPDGERCPACGWTRDAAGQPAAAPRRWAALLPGVLVALLAANGIAVARGLDGEVVRSTHRFERVGDSITELDDDRPNRELPEDLGTILPAGLEGWETLEVDGMTGNQAARAVTETLIEDSEDVEIELRNLERLGFRRSQGVAFLQLDGPGVVGLLVYELGSPADAEEYLDLHRATLRLDESVEAADVSYLEDEVAYTAPVDEGEGSLEVLFRIDQLAIRIFGVTDGPADESLLQPLHAALLGSLGA